MDDKERMGAIIGIRVCPSWKAEAMEEAKKRGETLSAFIWKLIQDGEEWNKIKRMLNKTKS